MAELPQDHTLAGAGPQVKWRDGLVKGPCPHCLFSMRGGSPLSARTVLDPITEFRGGWGGASGKCQHGSPCSKI